MCLYWGEVKGQPLICVIPAALKGHGRHPREGDQNLGVWV